MVADDDRAARSRARSAAPQRRASSQPAVTRGWVKQHVADTRVQVLGNATDCERFRAGLRIQELERRVAELEAQLQKERNP